ncbi:MAG: autotransporter-associated beta strand repeat-containing protein, partial [Chthoniobacterales bacterium]
YADTAGTVPVSGGVTVSNGMSFQTTGYDVQGGIVTLAGAAIANNTITTDTGVATTISSELAGTTGMTKAGAGSLILSASNTFSGNVAVNAGTLQITNDAALGNTANDLVNNGTLKTTATIGLNAGRDISGSGTYDIANATTLTVNGNVNNTATTLANTGTLDLQGATRSLGNITLNATMTLNAAGAINATGLTAPGVSSGTASINPDIVFTAGDKTLNVAAGGTVDLNGALSNGGGTGRIAKTGSGTLILSGANTMGGVRVGAAGATPTEGGTVILENSVIGTQAQAIQHNYGTLRAASNLVFTNGLSIGGRTNGAALLAGSNMEFQGASAFFRGTGTTGELVLNVDNNTTFSGG